MLGFDLQLSKQSCHVCVCSSMGRLPWKHWSYDILPFWFIICQVGLNSQHHLTVNVVSKVGMGHHKNRDVSQAVHNISRWIFGWWWWMSWQKEIWLPSTYLPHFYSDVILICADVVMRGKGKPTDISELCQFVLHCSRINPNPENCLSKKCIKHVFNRRQVTCKTAMAPHKETARASLRETMVK